MTTPRNRPERLERTRPIKSRTKATDTREGIVEALPGVSGNLDLQSDVIMPGAFTIGLREVDRPKMLFDHDWSKITGKSIEAEELLPKDPRLETYAPDLFASGYGALRCLWQLNLEKELARDVLSDIVFFDDEAEYSIGYETLDAEFVEADDGQPFRAIKGLITWEGSSVLFGANRLTRTVGAKGVGDAGVKDRLEELDEYGRKAVLETLSRTLGVKVTPGAYALAGGKIIGQADNPAAPTTGAADVKSGRAEGSLEARQDALRDALRAWGVQTYGENARVWLWATFGDHVVVELEASGVEASWLSIPYVIDSDLDVTFGNASEVEVVTEVRTVTTASAHAAVSAALDEDHGTPTTVAALVDLSPGGKSPEGYVVYVAGGKRFTRQWAADKRTVTLGDLGDDTLLPAEAKGLGLELLASADVDPDVTPDVAETAPAAPADVTPDGDDDVELDPIDLLEWEAAAAAL